MLGWKHEKPQLTCDVSTCIQMIRDTSKPIFLSDGQSFGESVLYRPNAKRTATVLTHSYCQLMMLSKAAIDSALQPRPEQHRIVMSKAKMLYREHTRRSKGDPPEEGQAVGRDALSLQSSVDIDDARNNEADSLGPNESAAQRLGGSPSKGAQMWQSLLSLRARDDASSASSAVIDKLSTDIADLKRSVKELLSMARKDEGEGEES